MADTKSAQYVSDPTDPIRALLISYAEHKIGAPGADGQITSILFKKGLASKRNIHPMKVGIHRKKTRRCSCPQLGGATPHGRYR